MTATLGGCLRAMQSIPKEGPYFLVFRQLEADLIELVNVAEKSEDDDEY